jgi:kynurenine formamidase
MPLTAQRFRAFTHFHLPRVTNQGYKLLDRLEPKKTMIEVVYLKYQKNNHDGF